MLRCRKLSKFWIFSFNTLRFLLFPALLPSVQLERNCQATQKWHLRSFTALEKGFPSGRSSGCAFSFTWPLVFVKTMREGCCTLNFAIPLYIRPSYLLPSPTVRPPFLKLLHDHPPMADYLQKSGMNSLNWQFKPLPHLLLRTQCFLKHIKESVYMFFFHKIVRFFDTMIFSNSHSITECGMNCCARWYRYSFLRHKVTSAALWLDRIFRGHCAQWLRRFWECLWFVTPTEINPLPGVGGEWDGGRQFHIPKHDRILNETNTLCRFNQSAEGGNWCLPPLAPTHGMNSFNTTGCLIPFLNKSTSTNVWAGFTQTFVKVSIKWDSLVCPSRMSLCSSLFGIIIIYLFLKALDPLNCLLTPMSSQIVVARLLILPAWMITIVKHLYCCWCQVNSGQDANTLILHILLLLTNAEDMHKVLGGEPRPSCEAFLVWQSTRR